MASPKKIFVVGGTGAQGIPIVRDLVKDNAYSVRVLTRDPSSKRAKDLVALNPTHVELVTGTFASESDLRSGLRGCWGAFVNIDGFNSGEKTEMFWTIRAYEIALEEGVKFYVHGNLDYVYKKSGYDPTFRTGHYDGKGRIGEWILLQNGVNGGRMGAGVFTTGPYIEMCVSKMTLMTPTVEEGVVTWRVPLGEGSVVHVSLDDCGHYVRWMFDNPERSNGMDLEVAIDHIGYHDLAAAFQKVTGHKAQFIDVSLEQYWEEGSMRFVANEASGYNSDLKDPAAMTMRQNFTGFWNMWKHSGGNQGVIKRDYALLDEIHPNRIRSAEQFFRLEDEKHKAEGKGSLIEQVLGGGRASILKLGEDKRRGRL